jgi:hypothetical protein
MSEAPQAPTSRYESIEFRMPDVEKFVAGLEAGVFEAYKTLGMALASIVDQPNQSDIFIAMVFGLMPESAQHTMLTVADGKRHRRAIATRKSPVRSDNTCSQFQINTFNWR